MQETKGTFLLKKCVSGFGPSLCYLVCPIVIFFYFAFYAKQRRAIAKLYSKLGNGHLVSNLKAYMNFLYFGHSLVDRMSFFSGNRTSRVELDLQKFSFHESLSEGGILVGSHLGDWSQCAIHLHKVQSISLHLVLDKSQTPQFQRYFDKASQNSCKIIDSSLGQMQTLFSIKEALSEKGVVCFLADRVPSDSNPAYFNFFGQAYPFLSTPFAIAARLKKPLLAFFCVRKQLYLSSNYEMDVSLIYDGKSHTDMIELLKKYVYYFEKVTKKFPTNWFNFSSAWSDNL